MDVVSLRTLRDSLRTLRLNFYRKERKGFRKGREEMHKITVDEVVEVFTLFLPCEGVRKEPL